MVKLGPGWAIDIDDVLTPTGRIISTVPQNRIEILLNDFSFLIKLPPYKIAQEILCQNKEKISGYISSRPVSQLEVTRRWLELNNFPRAQLVLRNPSNTRTNWKIHYLIKKGIGIFGLIDDNVDAFWDTNEFKGKKVWLNLEKKVRPKTSGVIELCSWFEVRTEMSL